MQFRSNWFHQFDSIGWWNRMGIEFSAVGCICLLDPLWSCLRDNQTRLLFSKQPIYSSHPQAACPRMESSSGRPRQNWSSNAIATWIWLLQRPRTPLSIVNCGGRYVDIPSLDKRSKERRKAVQLSAFLTRRRSGRSLRLQCHILWIDRHRPCKH